MTQQQFSTLVELVQTRAGENPHKLAYTFIDSNKQESSLTYAQLDEQVRAIATKLIENGLSGQRALLLYMPGFDYITAFFGCLYAGVVAVPAYPPDPSRIIRTLPRLISIIQDSDSKAILTTAGIESMAKELFSAEMGSANLKWIATDTVNTRLAQEWAHPKITAESLAFLQYTSGSTSSPRGVMLDHKTLLHNIHISKHSYGFNENDHGISWLPPYHDMGLIGGFLQPIYSNFPATMMSPLDFLSRPLRWLEAISNKKGTITAGPNFAYDLCVKKVTHEQREKLDLSSWKFAVNGAEPVRFETMKRFAEYFAPCGFRMEAFYPSYGLAEVTLYASGGSVKGIPAAICVDADALSRGEIITHEADIQKPQSLVSCGSTSAMEHVVIVDIETLRPSKPLQVGEIWISDKSVAKGYFAKPEQSAHTFGGVLTEYPGKAFLRTGDLGFIHENLLYITGRLKDLIVIRGRNYYPQDIELSMENSHESLKPGCGAAFAVDGNSEEQLVVVQEVMNSQSQEVLENIITSIRHAILQNHDLQPFAIVLVKAKSIPKTSSGKIQRHASKAMYLDGSLEIESAWQQESVSQKKPSQEDQSFRAISPIHFAIRQQLADVMGLSSTDNIQDSDHLSDIGLDSLMRGQLIGALEAQFQTQLPNNFLEEHPSIDSLARFFLRLPNSQNHATIRAKREMLPEYYDFAKLPGYLEIQQQEQLIEAAGLQNPFFTEHQGLVRDTTTVDGKTLINFSNYNYIGMAGDPYVSEAAKKSIDQYGTSVGASRLVSGDRPLHKKLEKTIAEFVGVDDSLVYVGGHATNVSTIGHLFNEEDLIVYDSFSHNSLQEGCKLSGAKRLVFPHNDVNALDRILTNNRAYYKKALIVIEGVYSMDGDVADLPGFVELKKKHKTFLMVDEAHSAGILGKTGRGIAEHFSANPRDVDLWMGTLSKSYASCGGYIAGCKAVVEYLRYTSPGFVYSVGISPPNAAAALAAFELLKKEPWRVEKLRQNSALFLKLAKARGFDTGPSKDSPIIPVILGDSLKTLRVSEMLLNKGINVRPIVYPAVEDSLSRLRFFITSCHNDEQIHHTINVVEQVLKQCESL